MKKDWQSFEDARDFVRSLKLEGTKDWDVYCTSGKKPKDIPANPNRDYKSKGWTNWGDFLGTGRSSKIRSGIISISFEEARKFAHSLKLKQRIEWDRAYESKKFPIGIPRMPNRTYKNKGWVSWYDWLNVEEPVKRLSFTEAREKIHSFNFKSYKEFKESAKLGKIPKGIPATPHVVYKNTGWTNWGDFLGTGKISVSDIQFRDFDSAREFARKLNLSGENTWREYCKSGEKPDDIPSSPPHNYKNKGWTNWGDFLGTGKISVSEQNKNWLNFKDARKIVQDIARKHNLKTTRDFMKAKREGLIPDNIPAKPWNVYEKSRSKNEK